jgi:RimJ/RimL family protein N-acetyltransferase
MRSTHPARMICVNPDWWPLAGLWLETPRLHLRVPSEADLDALATLAASGVHDPEVQPFAVPWTDASPAARARGTLQYQWRQRGNWTPDHWNLELVVARDGTVVGTQSMSARDFAVLREVSTGSWLGLEHQGQGIGTEMRAADLHLAFAGLGAQSARSGAFTDNPASLGVSRKLGYAADGIDRELVRGRAAVTRRLRLDAGAWRASHTLPVTIHGLEPCLPMFGLPASDATASGATASGATASGLRPSSATASGPRASGDGAA